MPSRAVAIRALPDCVPWDSIGASRVRPLDVSSPEAPARPGLSFTLCVSAGTEPGGKLLRWLGGHDRPPSGSWPQAPARRRTHAARVGAPSRSALCLKEKPRLPKKTGPELDSVRPLKSPVSPSAPTQHVAFGSAPCLICALG